jgi:hypothetical protein
MTATEQDEGPGPVEYQSVFSHPDFDPYQDAPQIATPQFEPVEDIPIAVPFVEEAPPPAEVSVAPTKRAESATPKEK